MTDYFDYNREMAEKYHSWYETGESRNIGTEQREILEIALEGARGGKLLEIGCGTCYFLSWLVERGFDVTGLDSSAGMLEFAKSRYGDDLNLHCGDAAEMSFEDRSFDVSMFLSSLEFIHNVEKTLAEAARVTKSSILFMLLNPEHPLNIKRMRKAGETGGVFSAAVLRSPEELENVFNASVPGSWDSEIVIEPYGIEYYMMEMIRRRK
ncbi:MAG TPA: class I SAM-dependent methyltransferase [bacterium]|nr:class I SAM-dependent methyltransferase [bacterium]